MELYKNIRNRRIELGLTQEDLAKKIGYRIVSFKRRQQMTGKLPANEKRPVLPAPSATRNVLPARNRKSSTPVPPRADIIL